MSANVPPIPVAHCLDPRLEIRPHEYVAIKGAAVNSWTTFPANNISNSNVSVVCNPPSREMAINRLVFQTAEFSGTISGTNTTGGPLLTEGAVGPRAMPLTAVTNAFQLTLNNVVATQSPIQQYWPTLMWLGDNDYANRFGQYSMTASMLDQAQEYADTFGSARNPLGPYKDNVFDNSRGGFVGFEITSNPNGGTTAEFTLRVTEPILVSPFVAGPSSNWTSCISGIQNCSVQMNLGDLKRILSIDNTVPGINIDINQINVDLDSYELTFQYFTPDPLYKMPSEITASYFNLTPYSSPAFDIDAGFSHTVHFNSIQLSNIPRRIIIFAREQDQDRTSFTSDTYLSLEAGENPLTINYDNNQFLSQARTEDLYNIAVKNGCQMSWTQYTREVGSIIILDAGIDFGLSPQDSPGVLKNVQLGLSCRFKNTGSRDITAQMYVVCVYEGVFNCMNGNTSLILAPLTNDDVLRRDAPRVTYEQQASVYGGGGNLFRSLGNAFRSAHNFVKDNRLISRGLSAMPGVIPGAAATIAKHVGYGAGRSGGGRSGGGRGRRARGGALEIEEQSEETSEDVSEEEVKPKKKKITNESILKRLRSKKILKASDLAEDY